MAIPFAHLGHALTLRSQLCETLFCTRQKILSSYVSCGFGTPADTSLSLVPYLTPRRTASGAFFSAMSRAQGGT